MHSILRSISCTAAVAAVLAATGPGPAVAKDGENARAAIAAIVGVTVAIAAAKHGQNHNANSQWDEGRYGEPFEPARGVTCVPRMSQCFEHGRVSWSWTRRIFG
jgi:hypothetical protein